MAKKIEFYKVEEKESIDCHIFTLNKVEKRNPKGNVSTFVELKAPDWVSAIVFDIATKKFVMVEQYRHGLNKVLTEFPCGMSEKGEDPLTAILRECKEEVGLKNPDMIMKLYDNAANPAFLDNHMVSYFITGEIDESLKAPDDNEFLNIKELTFEEVDNYIKHDKDVNVMLRLAWEEALQLGIKAAIGE